MKKVFILLLTFVILLSLAACETPTAETTPATTPVQTPVATPSPTPEPTPLQGQLQASMPKIDYSAIKGTWYSTSDFNLSVKFDYN